MPRRSYRFADFIKLDPRRSPRWRYERVRQLLDARPPQAAVRGRDDACIRSARKFLREWEALGRVHRGRQLVDARRMLFSLDPELYFAFDMFLATDTDKMRCEVEARILARQSNEEIAEEIHTLPGSVDYFEKLFFNVRDRLDNKGYIVNRIIAPTVMDQDWTNLNRELSTKFFGYFAGPVVLSAVLHDFDSSLIPPGEGQSTDEFFDAHTATGFRRRIAEAINAFEINKFNIVELLEVHTQVLKIARDAKQAAGGDFNANEAQMGLLLQTLDFAASPEQRQAAMVDSPLKPYHDLAGELRSDEMLRIVAGDVPDTVDELITLKMPERRERPHEQPAE